MQSVSFTYNLKNRSLRFRRWSRKRYAAFVSLHHTVTMGCLSANVADRLQGKQSSLHSSERISSSSYKLMENLPDEMISADNDISLSINICETIMLPVVLATSDSEGYYGQNIIKDISGRTEDAAFILRGLLSFFIGGKDLRSQGFKESRSQGVKKFRSIGFAILTYNADVAKLI